jgi:hypothetical protein
MFPHSCCRPKTKSQHATPGKCRQDYIHPQSTRTPGRSRRGTSGGPRPSLNHVLPPLLPAQKKRQMPKELHRIRRSKEHAGSTPARVRKDTVAKQQTHRTPQGSRFFTLVAALDTKTRRGMRRRTTCRGFDSRRVHFQTTGPVAQLAERPFSPQLSRRQKKPRDQIPRP